MRRLSSLIALGAIAGLLLAAPQKKNKEEETQTLELPKDLPGAVVGDTSRLTFHVTPLSAKGLLSQQVKDALKAVFRESHNETVLKLRAFVAGSGDLRRVRDLVSETFTDKKQPLPALTLVQSGGLPMVGAQVVFEAVAAARKPLHPQGLVFLAAQPAYADDPLGATAPLTGRTLTALARSLAAAGSTAADVLRVTCFLSSLDNVTASRTQVAQQYPDAALDFVQTVRAPARAMSACEAVAAARRTAPAGVEAVLPSSEGGPVATIVSAPQVVLSGAQVSFGYEERDAKLAFERLNSSLEEAGSSLRGTAFAQYYPLTEGIAEQVRKARAGFFDPARPPAGTMLLFESLPSMDAGFAVDVVAVKK